jgi:hypothetical protein
VIFIEVTDPTHPLFDTELGLTGTTAYHREGFKELLTKVTLGQVGIIMVFYVYA